MLLSAIASVVFSAASVAAQGICGSQIYTPGTATCYNGLLCVYKTDPATGMANIITFPCGNVCYDRANYVCNNGALVVATGTASIASLTRVSASTDRAGATGSATPIVSSAVLRSQSAAASASASQASSAASVRSLDATLVFGALSIFGSFAIGLVL